MVLFGSIVFVGTLSVVFGYGNHNDYSYSDIFPPPVDVESVNNEVTNTTGLPIGEGVYQNTDEDEQECYCKPYYSCESFVSTSDGAGFINIR